MSGLSWSPDRYARHAAPRLRPALDLLAWAELHDVRSVVDLGCGTGVLFPALRARFPAAALTGVDLSPAMLAKAAVADPDAVLVEADAAVWRPERPVDLIVANAALHWVPDHARLLPALVACCQVLAVQVPNNFAAPSHRLIHELASEAAWSARLGGLQLGEHVLDPARYHEIIREAGGRLDLWETTYFHSLTGRDPVLDWLRGTTLLPVHEALGGAGTPDVAAFERALAERLGAAYLPDAIGATLFPFKRLFLVAAGPTAPFAAG